METRRSHGSRNVASEQSMYSCECICTRLSNSLALVKLASSRYRGQKASVFSARLPVFGTIRMCGRDVGRDMFAGGAQCASHWCRPTGNAVGALGGDMSFGNSPMARRSARRVSLVGYHEPRRDQTPARRRRVRARAARTPKQSGKFPRERVAGILHSGMRGISSHTNSKDIIVFWNVKYLCTNLANVPTILCTILCT